jgi:hypothetical protein
MLIPKVYFDLLVRQVNGVGPYKFGYAGRESSRNYFDTRRIRLRWMTPQLQILWCREGVGIVRQSHGGFTPSPEWRDVRHSFAIDHTTRISCMSVISGGGEET